jgi:hypothetical protein
VLPPQASAESDGVGTSKIGVFHTPKDEHDGSAAIGSGEKILRRLIGNRNDVPLGITNHYGLGNRVMLIIHRLGWIVAWQII